MRQAKQAVQCPLINTSKLKKRDLVLITRSHDLFCGGRVLEMNRFWGFTCRVTRRRCVFEDKRTEERSVIVFFSSPS